MELSLHSWNPKFRFLTFFSKFLIAIGWLTIHMPSMGMVSVDGSWSEKYNRLRGKSGETEKITINVGFVDLGHIDLLVHESFMRASTPIAPTSSGRRFATSSPLTRMPSSNRSSGIPLNSAYDAIAPKSCRQRRVAGSEGCSRQAAHPGRRACDNRRRRHARTPACNNRINHRPWRSSRQQSNQGSAL
jgi:hypothetical protein